MVNGFEALVRGMSTAHHLADLLVAATGYVLEDLSVKPYFLLNFNLFNLLLLIFLAFILYIDSL